MKVKYISKIRKEMQTFLIKRSDGMFGDFCNLYGELYPLDYYDKVMARNSCEAVKRYCKRKHWTNDLNRHDQIPNECNLMFAKFRVLPERTPFDRHITHWN